MSTGLAFVDGVVPARLDDPLAERPLISSTRDAAMMHVPPVGRFLVRLGEPVLVERKPGATDDDVRAFLDTTVLALHHLLAGRFALRAATVAIDGRAVAICGSSGAGKSTSAAALARRGHAVLADSVTVVRDGVVHAGPSALTLWPDTLGWLGHLSTAGRVVRPSLPCRSIDPPTTAEAAPLAAVVILGVGSPGHGTTATEVRGGDRMKALVGRSWHTPLLASLGLAPDHFQWTIGVSAVPVFWLRRDRAVRDVEPIADAVEAVLA